MKAIKAWAALSVWALASPYTTPAMAAGSFCYQYEDGCYTSPSEACEAVAKKRREDKSVDNPYGQVAGARDEGDGFWCKLVDKTGMAAKIPAGKDWRDAKNGDCP